MQEQQNLMHLAVQRAMQSNQSQSENAKPIQAPVQSQQGSKLNQGNEADEELILEAVNRLRIAFPDNTREFYLLLYQRLKEAHFTRFMLVKKVNKIIDTYPYAKITIGAVLGAEWQK